MNKIITVTGVVEKKETKNFSNLMMDVTLIGGEGMEASDGYHTFSELYEHRITLFIALCRSFEAAYRHYGVQVEGMPPWKNPIWRAKKHFDDSVFEGWFILGIHTEAGKQITYHLPLSYWNDVDFAITRDRSPEWDGHSPKDVIERLKKFQ